MRINVTKNKLYWCHGYLLVQNADSRLQTGYKIQTADCREQSGYKMQCPCMTTSIIIKVTRVPACEHLSGLHLVVMVLRAQWPLGTIAQFFHFVAEEKKKYDRKTKAFYDWATTGIPVRSNLYDVHWGHYLWSYPRNCLEFRELGNIFCGCSNCYIWARSFHGLLSVDVGFGEACMLDGVFDEMINGL